MGWLTGVADTVGGALERTQPGYNRQRNLVALKDFTNHAEGLLRGVREGLGLLSEGEPSEPVRAAAYRALLSGQEPTVPMSEVPAQPMAQGDSAMVSAPAASVSSLASLAQGLMPGRQSVDVSESKSRAGVSNKQLQESESEYARSKRELLGMNRSSADKEARLAVMQAMRPTVLMGMYGTEGADEWDKQMQALASGLQRDDANRQKALEKVLTLEQKNIASQRSSESARAKLQDAQETRKQNDDWRRKIAEGKLGLDRLKEALKFIQNRTANQIRLYSIDSQAASSMPQFYADAIHGNLARRQALLNKASNFSQALASRGGKQSAALFGRQEDLEKAFLDILNESESIMQNDFVAPTPDQGVLQSLFPSAEAERQAAESNTLPRLGGPVSFTPFTVPGFIPSLAGGQSQFSSISESGPGVLPPPVAPPKPTKPPKAAPTGAKAPLGSRENPIVKGPGTPKPKSGQWYISPKTGLPVPMP